MADPPEARTAARPPAPAASDVAPLRQYQDMLASGTLAYQVAPDGTAVFPPRYAQPGTGAPLSWRESAGVGEVFATTVVRPRDGEPYNVAIIALDEGFRMMSRVVGIPPEEVRIGQRVALRIEDGVPVFEPR